MRYQMIGAIVPPTNIGINHDPSRDEPPPAIEIVSYSNIKNNNETSQARMLNNRTIRPYCCTAFSSLISHGTLESHGYLRNSNINGIMTTLIAGNNQIIDFEPQPSASPFALKWVGIVCGNVLQLCRTSTIPYNNVTIAIASRTLSPVFRGGRIFGRLVRAIMMLLLSVHFHFLRQPIRSVSVFPRILPSVLMLSGRDTVDN